ncbi:MAG: DUF3037 domain-containing protein [Muribaculaceae bacterium]|nr:DUF3037 domain-containing protein [Muribaculaceae bacterium]
MAAPDDLLYEYAVIRYVPRIDREEFVNIGVVMMNKRHKWLKGRVMIDDERIKALHPHSNIEQLKKQSCLFELKDVPSAHLPVEEKYRWLTAVKNGSLQVSPSHPGILKAEGIDPQSLDKGQIHSMMEDEFQRLFSILIL